MWKSGEMCENVVTCVDECEPCEQCEQFEQCEYLMSVKCKV